MGFTHLSPGLSRGQQREHRDASAVDAYFGVAHFADELDPAAADGRRSGPVLDPAAADSPQIVVVDHSAVGHEQFHGGAGSTRRAGK